MPQPKTIGTLDLQPQLALGTLATAPEYTTYDPATPYIGPTTPRLCPLQEVTGPSGPVRVQVPFSIQDYKQVKSDLGTVSDDPPKIH